MTIEVLAYLSVTFIFLLAFNSVNVPDRFRWSALSPFNFYLFLNFIFFLDFYFFFQVRDTSFLEQVFYVEDSDFYLGFYLFLFGYIALSIGICSSIYIFDARYVNCTTRMHYQEETSDNKSVEKVNRLQFYLILLVSVIILILNFKSILLMIAGDISKQNLFRDERALLFLFTFLPYSAALAISSTKKVIKKLLIVCLSSILMIFTDSRGGVIYMFLLLLYAYNFKYRKINVIFYLIALPAVAYLLTVLRYVFRESWRYPSFNSFIEDKGGIFQLFFNSVEISMAEVITTVIKFSDRIPRYPFESFFAGLTFPIPRNLYENKPIGGSGVFTSILSPDKWFYTKSEVVISGYGDFYLNFGFAFSIVLLFFIGLFWSRMIYKYVTSGVAKNLYYVPILMWLMYTLLRADIFNMMRWGWALIIFNMLVFFFKKLKIKSR